MARRSVLLTVALLIAALGTALIITYVQGISARAAEGQEMVKVLTTTETIDPGETMQDAQSAGKVQNTDVAKKDMVDGALTSGSSVADQVALSTIYPGEQLIKQKFGSAGSQDSLSIPKGKLAISVQLTDPARVAGFVNPGSDVAIFASAEPEVTKPDGSTQSLPSYTRLLLPKVQVIGVGDTSVQTRTTTSGEGQKTTEQIPRTILTLAVDQDQAQKVIFGSRNADLAFGLLNQDSKVRDKPGVSTADIMPELANGGGAR